jgi:hypothetical protein
MDTQNTLQTFMNSNWILYGFLFLVVIVLLSVSSCYYFSDTCKNSLMFWDKGTTEDQTEENYIDIRRYI